MTRYTNRSWQSKITVAKCTEWPAHSTFIRNMTWLKYLFNPFGSLFSNHYHSVPYSIKSNVDILWLFHKFEIHFLLGHCWTMNSIWWIPISKDSSQFDCCKIENIEFQSWTLFGGKKWCLAVRNIIINQSNFTKVGTQILSLVIFVIIISSVLHC